MKIEDSLPMLLLIPGLIASFLSCRMKWGAVAWMLTLLCFGYAIHDVASQPVGWFWPIFELPCLAVLVLGCCACAFAWPRGPGLRLANFTAALALTAVAATAYEWNMREVIDIYVTDASGNPIPEVRAEFTMSWNSTIKKRGEVLSDRAGRITLHSRRGWSSHMHLTPMADYSHDPDLKPQNLGLGIERSQGPPGMIKVYRGWKTDIGTATFNVAYSEILPYTRRLTQPVMLCRRQQLVSPLRREEIRAAFDSVRKHSEHGMSYQDVTRNLEAMDFIPKMIAMWMEGNETRDSLAAAMGWMAETLNEADRGCAEFQQSWGHPSNLSSRSKDAQIRTEIARLCEWAGIPDDGASPDRLQIEKVRDFIRSRAQTLLEFAMRFAETDSGARMVLGNLGNLARPALPELVGRLLKEPPNDMRAALDWSHVFFRLRATECELKPLIESGNPMLQTAARDARPFPKTPP